MRRGGKLGWRKATGLGVRGLGRREVGARLFPEIGLAATLHLHCRDWGFSLAQLRTTQQVNSYITVELKEKWMVRRKWIKILLTNGQSEWNKYQTSWQTGESGFLSEVNLKLIPRTCGRGGGNVQIAVRQTEKANKETELTYFWNVFPATNLWTLTNSLVPPQKTCISQQQPSPLTMISKPHTVMLLPLHPTEKLKISFWQPARKHPLLSAASHQGFVRQACSEPRAFKTPIMQQDSAGQKEQECFRQSCGHTGIIHSSVALEIFCESYKQRGGLQRLQEVLIIGSYIS